MGGSKKGKEIMEEKDDTPWWNRTTPPTAFEMILIEQFIQCIKDRYTTVQTLCSLYSARKNRKAEETGDAQEQRQSIQVENRRKELRDRIDAYSKKYEELRDMEHSLEETMLKNLESERELKSLMDDVIDMELNRNNEEIPKASSSSSGSKEDKD